MRRFVKPFYYICLGITVGYFVLTALTSYPSECWESGATKKYCVD